MLRTALEEALLERHGEDGAVFPAYGDYCFANVTPTALGVLGADTGRELPADVFRGVDTDIDRVVTVFLDGYGWEHWKRDHADVPLLSAVTDRGTVSPLTSIYPSETAAATTTFHTGLTPVEHGVLGWWQYAPAVDGVVQPLPWTTPEGEPAGEAYRDLDPGMVFPETSLYERAADQGVESRLHLPFPDDTYGDEARTYENVADLAVSLRQGIEAADGPEYQYAYVPNVDTAAHRTGTESDRYRAQLTMVTECLRRDLVTATDPDTAARTLLVLTADHGIVDTVPDENPDLRAVPGLWENLRRDGDGEPIPPVGSPRNVHLFLREGRVDRVRDTLESRFPCRTFTRAEAVERGLFGDREPSTRFRRRCGDLVVVHRDRGPWHEADERALVGMHGGLTREEMLVPFAAARLDALR